MNQLTLTFDIDERVNVTDEECKEYKALILCALARFREIASHDDCNRIDAIKDFFDE